MNTDKEQPSFPTPFDLEKIWQSKREFRKKLAARPIEEKLAMLDALRERQIAIRGTDRPRRKNSPS